MHHDEKYCKNCGQHLLLDQKFCHNCGQKSDTHRINYHFLAHEIQHGIFHIDGGIFFTVKELFTRPGHSIREYLDGRRQQHFKPVLLIMILGSIVALINHYLYPNDSSVENIVKFKKNVNVEIVKSKDADAAKTAQFLSDFADYSKNGLEWINHHFAIAVLLMIPFFAFAFFVVFRKYKLNFPEWLVISTFITGQSLAVYLVFLLIEKLTGPLDGFFFLAVNGLIFWTIVQLFHQKSKIRVALRTFLAVSLYYFIFGVIVLSALLFTAYQSLS